MGVCLARDRFDEGERGALGKGSVLIDQVMAFEAVEAG